MSRPTERLIATLIADGVLSPGEYRILRTYAGTAQRSEGAWSWYVVFAEDGREAFVGSQWNVREVLAMSPEDRAAAVS